MKCTLREMIPRQKERIFRSWCSPWRVFHSKFYYSKERRAIHCCPASCGTNKMAYRPKNSRGECRLMEPPLAQQLIVFCNNTIQMLVFTDENISRSILITLCINNYCNSIFSNRKFMSNIIWIGWLDYEYIKYLIIIFLIIIDY